MNKLLSVIVGIATLATFPMRESVACSASPGQLGIDVGGATKSPQDPNYYVVLIPDAGEAAVTVTITGSGDTPCPADSEKCICNAQKQDPDVDGTPIYTFSKAVGQQTPADGPTITWTVDASTSAAEYKFKLTKIEQKYKPCANGWTGGVGSKSNTQASREVTVCAVKISLSAGLKAVESEDSGQFKVTVAPATVVPTYQWLSGAPDAWPAAAGNNPALSYSAATQATTVVNQTRWFAPTNNRRQLVDGTSSRYSINCEVTVVGVKLKANKPTTLDVKVDMTGQTTRAAFQNDGTIVILHHPAAPPNGKAEYWSVNGQGAFSRRAAVASVNMPNTSQFYAKAMTHENKHVNQWTAEAPWKDLFDANALYNSTIKGLTSTVSAADLRNQINAAITTQRTADRATANNTVCTREAGAFQAQNAVAPHFLELDEPDWKPLYGCP